MLVADQSVIPIWVLLCLLIVAVESAAVIEGVQTIAPPEFSPQPTWPDANYYDEYGPPIRLSCRLKSGNSVTVIWTRDGKVIPSNNQQYDLENGNMTLTLTEPVKGQTGLYKCLALNTAGSISHSGYIFITAREQETRPRVTEVTPSASVVYAAVGDGVNISCTFDVGGSEQALFDLAMEWQKEGMAVNDTNHTTWGINTTSNNNQVFSLNIHKIQKWDYGRYSCYGENSQGNASKDIMVTIPPPNNKPLPITIIVGCSMGGLVVIAILVVMVTIRKRSRRKYEQLEWPDLDGKYDVPERPIEYDVFISYSSEDLTWVKNVLFYNLTEMGYNVCIDFKDFLPGNPIVENIMESIYKSRKTIVLMSHNFLKSVYGQFELEQAHNRAILQRQDVLILIKYDDSLVPDKLMGKTFLDWSDPNVKPHFWTRLYQAIGDPETFKEAGDTERTPDNEEKDEKLEEITDENREMADKNEEFEDFNEDIDKEKVGGDMQILGGNIGNVGGVTNVNENEDHKVGGVTEIIARQNGNMGGVLKESDKDYANIDRDYANDNANLGDYGNDNANLGDYANDNANLGDYVNDNANLDTETMNTRLGVVLVKGNSLESSDESSYLVEGENSVNK